MSEELDEYERVLRTVLGSKLSDYCARQAMLSIIWDRPNRNEFIERYRQTVDPVLDSIHTNRAYRSFAYSIREADAERRARLLADTAVRDDADTYATIYRLVTNEADEPSSPTG